MNFSSSLIYFNFNILFTFKIMLYYFKYKYVNIALLTKLRQSNYEN